MVAVRPSESLRPTVERLTPVLEQRGLAWRQLPDLIAARHEMFEMDAKFGALGERGIFNALDAAGALRHRVRDCDVANAVLHPPQDTRARIRGDVVRRLSEAGTPYGAEWTCVYDRGHHRELDLTNPFETEERWRNKTQ
jgi:proteasome accessory factor A